MQTMAKEIGSQTEFDPAWIALIPIFHLALSAVHLQFYSYGFGHSIGPILRASDALDVALRTSVQYYLGVAVGFLFSRLARLRENLPPGGRLEDLLRRYPEDEAKKKHNREKNYIKIYFLFILISTIAISVIAMYHQNYGATYMIFITITILIAFAPVYWNNHPFDQNITGPIKLGHVIIALSMFSFFGFESGRFEGEGSVNIFKSNPMCGDYMLIRPISAGMVALDKSGTRFIINDNCDIVLRLKVT